MSFTETDTIEQHLEQIFQAIPELFISEKAKDVDGAYQVIFTDVDYPWHTVIEGNKCSIYKGIHPHPTVTMTVRASDFVDITYGKLTETVALMRGKLKIQGNMVLAVKYSQLFYKQKNS